MAITAFREGGLAEDGGDAARKRRRLRIPLDCSTAEAARMLRLRFNREAECAWPAPRSAFRRGTLLRCRRLRSSRAQAGVANIFIDRLTRPG